MTSSGLIIGLISWTVFYLARRGKSSLIWTLLPLGIIIGSFAQGISAGIVAILFVLFFLLVQWPFTCTDASAPWILLVCVITGSSLLRPAHMPWTGAASGVLWFMLSLLIYNYRSHWLKLGSQAKWNAPAHMMICLIAWPGTAMLLARQYAQVPIIAACGLACAAAIPVQPLLLFPAWVICTFAILGLDRVFAICGERLRIAFRDKQAE